MHPANLGVVHRPDDGQGDRVGLVEKHPREVHSLAFKHAFLQMHVLHGAIIAHHGCLE